MSARMSMSDGSSLQGVLDDRFGAPVDHFRGIPYGCLRKRFAKPEYLELSGDVDATRFGPQCPQPHVDVGHLLRVPPHIELQRVEEDEFKCLNLNVSRPAGLPKSGNSHLPVLVWIHGGSQCVTFPSAATAIGDPTRLVADSVRLGKPIVVVTFNYRLNIFAFGDGVGERNLALQDQRLAIEWVYKNIREFGGDPDNITLAGESAGAIYVHAHLLSQPRTSHVRRAIMASGSLHLSPPLPKEAGAGFLQRISADLASRGGKLEDATAESLVQALENCGITSFFLQQDAQLEGWEERIEQAEALLISDVEYESNIWRNGIQKMSPEEIASVFNDFGEQGLKLKELYHIYPDRPASCYHGALDLINDARFAFPAFEMSERLRKKDHGKVYQFVFDEVNPWQASSRAHHAVDVVLLFGGVDLNFNPAAERVGSKLRETWVTFVNGGDPWPSSAIWGFGPLGRCAEVDAHEYRLRRRVHCFEYLRSLGIDKCRQVSGRLAAGRVSLLN